MFTALISVFCTTKLGHFSEGILFILNRGADHRWQYEAFLGCNSAYTTSSFIYFRVDCGIFSTQSCFKLHISLSRYFVDVLSRTAGLSRKKLLTVVEPMYGGMSSKDQLSLSAFLFFRQILMILKYGLMFESRIKYFQL